MTTRLYLRAVNVTTNSPSPESIPVERFFVNSSDPPEIWVETDVISPPAPGKAAVFALTQDLHLGFRTVKGTVERHISK